MNLGLEEVNLLVLRRFHMVAGTWLSWWWLWGWMKKRRTIKREMEKTKAMAITRNFVVGFVLLDDLYICICLCWSPAVALVATPPSDIIKLHLFV